MEVENNVSSKGYHGGFSSNVNDQQLQKCSTAEIDMSFSLEQKASLKSDEAVVNLETQQSIGPGSYHLDNMYGCECGLPKARDLQLSQPAINFNGGAGWMGENGCLIDNDTKVRFDELTNKKYINQLPKLQNQGFFGKGAYDVDTEFYELWKTFDILPSAIGSKSTFWLSTQNYPNSNIFGTRPNILK